MRGLKTLVLLGVTVAITVTSLPSQADIFIRRDKGSKTKKTTASPRSIFIAPKKSPVGVSASITNKKVTLRPEINRAYDASAKEKQIIQTFDTILAMIPKSKIPKDFDKSMLSAGGTKPKTERDLEFIAYVKKFAQLQKISDHSNQ